jgi:hypothetical protein
MSDETVAIDDLVTSSDESTIEKLYLSEQQRRDAIENGDLQIIEHFNYFTVFDTFYAAQCGRLNALIKLFEMGCPWDWQTTTVACAMGNLDVLQFAFENGCPVSVHCASQAALFNHEHVLRFIAKNNFPVDWRTPANVFLSKNSCTAVVEELFPNVRQKSLELKALREPLDNCAQQGLFHIRPMSLQSRIKRLHYA